MNLDFFINMGVTALFMAIKNPLKKQELRKICLKVYQTLKITYAGDSDFS